MSRETQDTKQKKQKKQNTKPEGMFSPNCKLNLLRDNPSKPFINRYERLKAIEEAQRVEEAQAEVRAEMVEVIELLHALPDTLSAHVSGALAHFEVLAHVHEQSIQTILEHQKDVFDVRTDQMQHEIQALRRQVALLSQIVAKLELELGKGA